MVTNEKLMLEQAEAFAAAVFVSVDDFAGARIMDTWETVCARKGWKTPGAIEPCESSAINRVLRRATKEARTLP